MPAKKAAPAAKKSATTAKAAVQATITLKHLAATLSDSHDLPKKQTEAMLGDLVTLATRYLKKGDKVRLTGLGILQVRKRDARMGRNPATGEAIKINVPTTRPIGSRSFVGENCQPSRCLVPLRCRHSPKGLGL